MFKEERLLKIINKINSDKGINKGITIKELSEAFNVSPSTIRRDLTELEEAGVVKRTHGGAILVEQVGNEYDFLSKQGKNVSEKKSIAKYAASLVGDGEIIALNSSTLTYLMAAELDAKNISIITNSVGVVNQLSDKRDYSIIVLGGIYLHSAKTIEGTTTVEQISKMHFDKVFLGANGVDLKLGLSTAGSIEASSKQAMVDCGKEIYFLCESTKFDKASFYKIADFSQVNAIITDDKLTDKQFETYNKYTKIVRV